MFKFVLSLFLLLGASSSLQATLTDAFTVPETPASGQDFIVIVPGDSLGEVHGTLDLTPVGGTVVALSFSLTEGRWQSTALTLPTDPGFGSAALGLDLTATSGGEALAANFSVKTSSIPVLDSSVLCETFPASIRGGEPFSLLVAGPELAGGTASVNFAPFAELAITSPLEFSMGRGSVSFATPVEVAGSDQRRLSLRLFFEDIAGNAITSFKQLSILPTGGEGIDSVVLRSFSVDPSPVQPGQAFTLTAETGNADRGVALIDFRPHLPQVFRLPLSFEDGVATANGTAPANLPADIDDFLTARVILQSEDGSRQDEILGVFPLVSLPPAPDLGLKVTSPEEDLLTRDSSATVSGTIGADITSLSINRTEATVSAGQFSALVPLKEGVNELLVVGRDDAGNEARTIFRIERDSTRPLVNIEVPTDGAVLTMRETTVAGFVNDLAETTITSALVTVTVNGVPAQVTNRSYELQNFPIVPGTNVIRVVATDRAGNVATATHEITSVEAASQQTIRVASGNNQFGRIAGIVAEPLVVEVIDALERPQPNVPVTFEVIRGDGILTLAEETDRSLTFMTDDAGRAEVFFRLGSRTGEGNNRVSARSPGFLGEVIFCASAVGSVASQIGALEPVFQTGQPGEELPLPLQVYVTDEGGNPLGGVPVEFQVQLGGGTIYGQSLITIDSAESGRISVPLLLSESLTDPRYLVSATIVGGEGEEVTAVFEGLIQLPAAVEDTRVVGVVLDSANRPMPSVTMYIKGEETRVLTDEEGQFSIPNVPLGDVVLEVDGSTTTLPGEWPHMEYELFTIAGQANRVDRPIFLLPLDAESTKLVGGDEDVILQLAGVPGATLTVKAGSVTGVNGESVVPLRWTQVNRERVPMAPPLGAQFSYVTTVQPPNIRFDPPAIMQFPNHGGEPGQQIEMFSFDHDIGDYVSLGTATVSGDGSVVRSDPGFGLRKSGWSGFVPPPPPCKPAETTKPRDTDCETWFEVPRTHRCQAKRYHRKRAKILSLELKAGMGPVDSLMSNEIVIFTNEDLTFTAQAISENCKNGLAYQWQFPEGVNGDIRENSAAAVRSFSRAGTYTITGAAQCRLCPDTRMEKTLSVKVISGDKLITMKDSDGRVAASGKLEIVAPDLVGEVINLTARYRDGKEPPEPPEWTITGPGISRTEVGKDISFVATYEERKPEGLIELTDTASNDSTYTITCEDGETQQVVAYPSDSLAFSVSTALMAPYTKRINDRIEAAFQSKVVQFQGPTGKVSLGFGYKECPTSPVVSLGITASGGFDPLVGITGEFEVPLERFLSSTGPFGFGASVAIGFMEDYLGFEVGLFLVPSGSVGLTGEITRDGCGVISGDNFLLTGKVGLEIKLAAKLDGLGEIKVFGATGISTNSNLDVLNTTSFKVEKWRFDFDGIDVGISISGEVTGMGESMPDQPGRTIGVESQRKWNPVGKIPNIAGPITFEIPYK